MKLLTIAFLLFSYSVCAQEELQFTKRFVESEDRWVAFQKGKDSSYVFGFIYIDAQAGLTLQYEGSFIIDEKGRYTPLALGTQSRVKVRLSPNQVKVAFIPESRFKELSIVAIPNWLSTYKKDTNSVERLYRWGYLYNEWGECAKALNYLERAKMKDSSYAGLINELAFSYNCLKQYNKAIEVLESALRGNPTDAYLHKELGFAYAQSGQLENAAAVCRRMLRECTDTTFHGETLYNLLQGYYIKKDKESFLKWYDEALKWTASNKQLSENIQLMKQQLGK